MSKTQEGKKRSGVITLSCSFIVFEESEFPSDSNLGFLNHSCLLQALRAIGWRKLRSSELRGQTQQGVILEKLGEEQDR